MRGLLSSTIARLVVAAFLLQVLTGGAAMLLLYNQLGAITRNEQGRQVLDTRDDLLADYRDEGIPGLRALISQRKGSASDPRVFIVLDGPEVDERVHVAQVPAEIAEGGARDIMVSVTPGGPALPAIASATRLKSGHRLVVGTLKTTEAGLNLAFAEAVSLTLALTVVLSTLSALGLGIFISRRTHAIAATAEALASGNFAARVEQEESGDGFDHLRRQINLMAERIDQLLQQLGTVSAALAHDLRSPVARLRASIETAMAKTDDAEAGEALAMARNDADVLQRMLAAGLELSRLESGTVADRRARMDLGEATADLAELYEPLAESSGIALTWQVEPVIALADRELLSRAIANLIDNSMKYGAKTISVRCLTHAGEAVICVDDDGPGIADVDLPRAVVRYSRLDNARTLPGAGLGLALASAVAQLHGGRLEISSGKDSGKGGLRACLHIPIA